MDNNAMTRIAIFQSAMSRMIDHGINPWEKDEFRKELLMVLQNHFPDKPEQKKEPLFPNHVHPAVGAIASAVIDSMVEHHTPEEKQVEVTMDLYIILAKHFPPSKTASTPPPGETTS